MPQIDFSTPRVHISFQKPDGDPPDWSSIPPIDSNQPPVVEPYLTLAPPTNTMVCVQTHLLTPRVHITVHTPLVNPGASDGPRFLQPQLDRHRVAKHHKRLLSHSSDPNNRPKFPKNLIFRHFFPNDTMPPRKLSKPTDGQIDTMSRTLASRPIRTRSLQAYLDQTLGRNMPSFSTHFNFARSPTPYARCVSTPNTSITGVNPHISPFLSAGSSNSNSISNLSSATTSDGIGSSPMKRPAPVPNSPVLNLNINHDDNDDELPPRFEDEYVKGRPVSLHVPAQISNTSQAPTQTSPAHAEWPKEARKYSVHFNLWQPECPAEPEPKKHKRTPGGSRPSQRKSTKAKYNNYAPKVPTYITFKPDDMDFGLFKSQLFKSCNEHLPGVDQVLHRSWVQGGLLIMGYINGSKGYKGRDKEPIKTPSFLDHSFKHFLEACKAAPASSKMGFRIVHENPLKTETALRSLAHQWPLME
ncbi:uncharacterized protein MELLADRAFT_90346 [Melampsora larici-populina 98AG31]|uniref:Uncharacterized protein n=1 Tax=Melampsora larici-populina (strain 98AG31 / pathotype 3-4-7) TaxID=747676 RepID=F4SEE6_MELLP|nr:uncharacterized protein MELLADRAFT_90346 [Melampsora larici-populina 98AG31]EGF96981.1 hypothetical protein MELLADRAFT_90346 [Melampsora larici-populina 98AG31]